MSLTAPALSATVSSPLDLIGKTPMVEVTKIDTGPCRLLLKLESQNPGGSIKDRIAISMLDAAEREGFLKEGGTIVEATAGNTGLALTLVGRARGYKVLLVIPDKMSKEKIQHLRAMGADVRLTRSTSRMAIRNITPTWPSVWPKAFPAASTSTSSPTPPTPRPT